MKKTKSMLAGFVLMIAFMMPGMGFSWPVPDTGQTKCYDDVGNEINPCPSEGERFYGQDGCYSINPMSYTKLDENGSNLPDDAATWVMVRDNVTGLIWEMKQDKDGVKNYANSHDADNTYTWYDPDASYPGTPGNGTDTEDFINSLNSSNYGGYSDWRLPTLKELESIVNMTIPPLTPCINKEVFPNTIASWYWSSITAATNIDRAWVAGFGLSYGGGWIKSSEAYTRAVRGWQ